VKNMNWIITALCLLIILASGCENTPTEVEDYDPEPVLTAFIESGKPVGTIWLERVMKDLGSLYVPENTGISDAVIELFPISDNALNNDTLTFADLGGGKYQPDNPDYIIEHTVRYKITANKPSEGVNMWAETAAPDIFTLQVGYEIPSGDSLIFFEDPRIIIDDSTITFDDSDLLNPFFQKDGQNINVQNSDSILPVMTRDNPFLVLKWSSSDSSGGILFHIIALTDTASLELLSPPDPNDEEEEEELEPEQKGRVGRSLAPNYQDEMGLLWIFFQWEGAHRIDIMAASYEYYRYAFTTWFGGPPTASARPESNMNGGLGVFGATCTHSFYLYMKQVEL